MQQQLAQVGVTIAVPAAVQAALQQAEHQAQQSITQFGVNMPTTRSRLNALGLQLGSAIRLPNVLTAKNSLKVAVEVRERDFDNLWTRRGIPRDATTGLTIVFSIKRHALLSRYHESGSIYFNKDLTDALDNGNCAEAWLQIRYNSKKGVGVADRRYREADLFGLYDGQNQPVSDQDVVNAILTLRRNLAFINQYEGSHNPLGTPGFQEQLIPAAGDGVGGHDLTITGPGGTVTGKGSTNGQFGIRLVDVSTEPDGTPVLPTAIRTDYQKVGHYQQVGTDPEGNPI